MAYQITTLVDGKLKIVKVLEMLPAEVEDEGDIDGWHEYIANYCGSGKFWITLRTNFRARNVLGKGNSVEVF